MDAPNLKFLCRTGFAGRARIKDYPSSSRVDEVDTTVIFDNLLIPWENVLFYRDTEAASLIRATPHRYSLLLFSTRLDAGGHADRNGSVQHSADRHGLVLAQCCQRHLGLARSDLRGHLFPNVGDQASQHRIALIELLQRNELVRLVSLVHAARAADHGGNARPIEQSTL